MGLADHRDLSVSEGRIGVREVRPSVRSYLVCLTFLSVAAFAILFAIGRAFRTVIDNLGVSHSLPLMESILLTGMLCTFQVVYWYRIRNINLPEWRSAVFGHLVGFASRLSFIVGGALFSVFFLRHAPDLNSSEGAIVLLPRVTILTVSLFCLYCYTLELERLANTLQLNIRIEARDQESGIRK
jgi:hypothetical protein